MRAKGKGAAGDDVNQGNRDRNVTLQSQHDSTSSKSDKVTIGDVALRYGACHFEHVCEASIASYDKIG